MKQKETMMERWARENGMERAERAEDGGNIPVSPMGAEIVLWKIKEHKNNRDIVFKVMDDYFPDCNEMQAQEIAKIIVDEDVKLSILNLERDVATGGGAVVMYLKEWAASKEGEKSKEGKKRKCAIKVDDFQLTGMMAHPANRIYLDVGVRYGVLEPDNYAVVIGTTKEHFFVYASEVIRGAMGNHRFKKIAGETWKDCFEGNKDFLKDQRETRIAGYREEKIKIKLIMSDLGIAGKQPKKLIKL